MLLGSTECTDAHRRETEHLTAHMTLSYNQQACCILHSL